MGAYSIYKASSNLASLEASPNLSRHKSGPVAHHTSSGQAFKDGRFEEALYMEYALMQQPSHMLQDGHQIFQN